MEQQNHHFPPIIPHGRSGQPVSGYPLYNSSQSLAANNNNGRTVTGYPISRPVYPSNNRRFTATSTNQRRSNLSSYDGDETIPLSFCERVLWAIAFIFAIFPGVFLLTIGLFFIPPVPVITVVSASASASSNVSNANADHQYDDVMIIQDLNVGILIENLASKGMIYRNMTLMAFYGEGQRLSYDVISLEPFEQAGYEHKTLWVELKDMKVPRVDDENDNKSGVVAGVARVRFGLKGHVRYRGKAWSKQEIPIEAECEKVTVDCTANGNDNATAGMNDFDMGRCVVKGLWTNAAHLMIDFSFFIPVLVMFLTALVWSIFLKVSQGFACGAVPNQG